MKFVVAIFLTFYWSAAFPQEKDSLTRLVQSEKNPEKRAKILLKLVNFYTETDSLQAKKYIQEAEKLTKKSNTLGQADILNSWGNYYLPRDLDKSLNYFKSALKTIGQNNTPDARDKRAKSWYNIAAVTQRNGNKKEAIQIVLSNSIPAAKQAPDQMYLANNYLLIGLIFSNENNTDKALQYFGAATEVLEKMKNSKSANKFLTVSLLYSAEVYIKQQNFAPAKSKLDEAARLLQQYPNPDIQNEYYHLRSVYYLDTGQYAKALEEAEAGLRFSAQYKNTYQQIRLTFIKAQILPFLNRHDEAVSILQELMKSENYVVSFGKNIGNIYKELSKIEEDRGNYKKALEYATSRIEYTDSVNATSQNKSINEMETRFRTAEKEKQLAQNNLEISKKNTYMLILGLLTLLFLSSSIFIYKNFKNKKKIAEQREINLQQKLREKEKQEELKVTKAILEGEERERERVAKDLHDGLGGMLAGVKINLSTWCSNHVEEGKYDSFNKILDQLDTSVSELRRVARNLMPESLLNFGLEIALKDLCEFYMKDGLKIHFQAISVNKNLPLNLQINIYRIVQELLSNAVKHSEASNILVQCSQSADEFYITVEDNGKGMDAAEMNKLKSLGLKNVKNRIDYLKGKLDIQSSTQNGTFINIELKTHATA